MIPGGGSTQIWQYRLETDTWVLPDDLGAPSGVGTSIPNLWGECYYVVGGSQSDRFLARPDPGGPQSCPEAGPLTSVPAPVGAGGSAMAATRYNTSPNDYVYALRANATRAV